jgi:hypothetical protein
VDSTFSWDHLLHSKRSLYLPSCKHRVFFFQDILNDLRVLSVVVDHNEPRQYLISVGRRSFPLLHVQTYRTADRFILTVAAWRMLVQEIDRIQSRHTAFPMMSKYYSKHVEDFCSLFYDAFSVTRLQSMDDRVASAWSWIDEDKHPCLKQDSNPRSRRPND